ncbi:MAG: ATP-binding protein [Terriglobales bacterium]
MQDLPQLTLLFENGYKLFSAADDRRERRPSVHDLQNKMASVAQGNLDTTLDFADRSGEMGALGRNFNRMVQQLRASRDRIDRLHRTQISRAEHLASVGEAAAGCVHDIRNGIGAIAGWTEVVGRDLPATSPALAVIKDVGPEIARIHRILTQLLQAARPSATQVRSSDLSATVEHAVALARLRVLCRPITIALERGPNLPDVEHDRTRIQQLLLTLLMNAVQAIDGAGLVRVEMSRLRGNVAIAVIDSGRGIAPESLPNIFLPFFTTRTNGTGLGLSLARRIAEEHYGRIEVSSEIGKGSTFLVVLPLQPPSSLAAAS